MNNIAKLSLPSSDGIEPESKLSCRSLFSFLFLFYIQVMLGYQESGED